MVQRGIRPSWLLAGALLVALVAAAGCSALSASRPIMPVSEYEKLIAGRLDANYVGDRLCLAKCHEHDTIKKYFDASTMGAQLSAESGLPLVNCESCHGPGSLAIDNIKVVDGRETCGYDTFIDLAELPKQAQSLICLKCHSGNANFNLHNWNAGTHNMSGVSCFDCHSVHKSADLKVHPKDVSGLCYGCHEYVQAEFMLPTHHAVPEQKVSCLDCHETHGSTSDKQLKETTTREGCTSCHAEKEGPFAYEHADVTEDCLNCHVSHGSINDGLLNARLPFLCLQCHGGTHGVNNVGTSAEILASRFTRCTDCHTEIHGSDTPGNHVPGSFIK